MVMLLLQIREVVAVVLLVQKEQLLQVVQADQA
jgi:hypothetical protein